MEFSGTVFIPRVEHAGIPATFVVDDNQVELLAAGQTLGRWSIHDVLVGARLHDRVLLSFDGEDLEFRGSDHQEFDQQALGHMDVVRATMRRLPSGKRVVAVRKARRGTITSSIEELRKTILESGATALPAPGSPIARLDRIGADDREVEPGLSDQPHLADPTRHEPAKEARDTSAVEAEIEDDDVQPASPEVSDETTETADEDDERAEASEATDETVPDEQPEPARFPTVGPDLAAQSAELSESRAALEQEWSRLASALMRAETLEAERQSIAESELDQIQSIRTELEARRDVESAGLEEISRQKAELEDIRRANEEEHELALEAIDARKAELDALQSQYDSDRAQIESQVKSLELMRREQEELARLAEDRLDQQRTEIEARESEWLDIQRRERDDIETQRRELDRREAKVVALEEEISITASQLEIDRRQLERLNSSDPDSARIEAARLRAELAERAEMDATRSAYNKAKHGPDQSSVLSPTPENSSDSDGRHLAADQEPAGNASVPDEPAGVVVDESVREVISTSSDEKLDSSKDLVIDLRGLEEEAEADIKANARTTAKAGKKSRFGFGSKTHVHTFETAPGIAGMTRNICSECGYISIDSED